MVRRAPWWREWPLALAVVTLVLALLGKGWIATAKHPQTGKRFVDMTYQPMLEVLAYLRANGFKNFIVSGGGIEFMRPWTEAAYGIPPEQVVGSSMKTKFELRGGQPVLVDGTAAILDPHQDRVARP